MKSNRILLLGTFLKATSKMNVLKHAKDPKKKKGIIGNAIAFGLVYFMILAYALVMAIALGQAEMAEMIPSVCSTMLVGFGFVFTLLKSNGYLYGFKEFDILISMPFTEKDIVSAKFLYMYIKSLPLMLILSAAMLTGYLLGGAGNGITVVIWTVLTFVLPVIPMILASALGALIVRIGINFKHKKMVQTILTFIFVIPCFFANYIIQEILRNNRLEEIAEKMSGFFNKATAVFSPSEWFVKAINENSIPYSLLLMGVTLVVFEAFFAIVCKSYKMMNSRLSQGAAGKKYRMEKQKERSVVKSIAFKEYKRVTGSTTCMVQLGMGTILTVIMGILFIFVDGETLISKVTGGAPLQTGMLIPAVPLIIYFIAGMVSSTVCTPSLEGKNYWIMQTLPIDPIDDCRGKLLFQYILAIPTAVFATITLAVSFHAGLIDTILSVIAIIALCVFSSVWGLRCGIKHKKLEWDNEIEVVKQSAAVSIYLLPNMFATMLLVVGVVFINNIINNEMLIFAIIAIVASLLAWLSWCSVKKLIKKEK